jgi:hypothetical protein
MQGTQKGKDTNHVIGWLALLGSFCPYQRPYLSLTDSLAGVAYRRREVYDFEYAWHESQALSAKGREMPNQGWQPWNDVRSSYKKHSAGGVAGGRGTMYDEIQEWNMAPGGQIHPEISCLLAYRKSVLDWLWVGYGYTHSIFYPTHMGFG